MPLEQSMDGLKILFLATKATRPSYRFRVEQMIPHLRSRGHRCGVAFFPKNPVARFWFYRYLAHFDVVVIQQRTMHPTELQLVRYLSKRLIFDVDDSVMFDRHGQVCSKLSPRFDAMVSQVDLVICGNPFLKEQTSLSAGRVKRTVPVQIIPTAIDTHRFQPKKSNKPAKSPVTIGWTGSSSTNPLLNNIFPVLARVQGNVELKVISDSTKGLEIKRLGRVPFRFVPWSAASEVRETSEFDIGLMPLKDDNLSRGKCACKLLQYMALGIPAVVSGIGVNREIVQHGENGFIPDSDERWIENLNELVADTALRERIGTAGRLTAERGYSLKKIAMDVADAIENPCAQTISLNTTKPKRPYVLNFTSTEQRYQKQTG